MRGGKGREENEERKGNRRKRKARKAYNKKRGEVQWEAKRQDMQKKKKKSINRIKEIPRRCREKSRDGGRNLSALLEELVHVLGYR